MTIVELFKIQEFILVSQLPIRAYLTGNFRRPATPAVVFTPRICRVRGDRQPMEQIPGLQLESIA
jgi:hypothetical protein